MAKKKARRPYGWGGISEKPDARGLYLGTIRLPDGTRRYVRRASRKEVEDELDRLRLDAKDGSLPPPERLTVARYLEYWLETAMPSLAYNTQRCYRQRANRLIEHTGLGNKRMIQVTAMDVQHALAALLRKFAPETVRQARSLLHHSFADAMKWGMLKANVVDLTSAPRVPKGEPRILSQEQVDLLMERTAGDHYHGLWALMVTTGLRLGEATGLRWRDVDLTRRRISVQATIYRVAERGMERHETKTAGSKRQVPLAPFLVPILKSMRAQQAGARMAFGPSWNEGDLVFVNQRGNPTDPANLHKVWDRTLARLGLPEVDIHDLRHTAASLLLRRGVHPKKVQALLGHSSIRTTMDLYSHIIEADSGDVADEMEALFGKPQETTKRAGT